MSTRAFVSSAVSTLGLVGLFLVEARLSLSDTDFLTSFTPPLRSTSNCNGDIAVILSPPHTVGAILLDSPFAFFFYLIGYGPPRVCGVVHLSCRPTKRASELGVISSVLRDYPVAFLGGDFNFTTHPIDNSDSRVVASLQDKVFTQALHPLCDPWRAHHLGTRGYTHFRDQTQDTGRGLARRLDRIYTHPIHAPCVLCEIVPTPALSDHSLILCMLSWVPRGEAVMARTWHYRAKVRDPNAMPQHGPSSFITRLRAFYIEGVTPIPTLMSALEEYKREFPDRSPDLTIVSLDDELRALTLLAIARSPPPVKPKVSVGIKVGRAIFHARLNTLTTMSHEGHTLHGYNHISQAILTLAETTFKPHIVPPLITAHQLSLWDFPRLNPLRRPP